MGHPLQIQDHKIITNHHIMEIMEIRLSAAWMQTFEFKTKMTTQFDGGTVRFFFIYFPPAQLIII